MINVIDFGIKPYREIWGQQKKLFETLVDAKSLHKPIKEEYLLIGEHLPVYTLGFHGDKNNLLLSESELFVHGAELIRIERGGDITYHAPGQLILYPIIDLESRNAGIKDYMYMLEECVIGLLNHYGIKGDRINGATGVWIGGVNEKERKICAMGVRCRRHITMHGLALNVSTDLSGFSAINPCGFVDKGVTSLYKELNLKGEKDCSMPEMKDVKKNILEIFGNLFGSYTCSITPRQNTSNR